MKDLMTAYDTARFGKAAADDERGMLSRIADHFAMSKLTPRNRKLRDTIEQSIRDEKRLREQAKGEITAAKEQLAQPPSTGGLSWITDLIRSSIPGLAPVAAPKDDGITKKSVELNEGPSTLGTLAHILSAGTGAGLGAGIQTGAFGGLREAQRLAEAYPEVSADFAQRIAAEAKLPQNLTGRPRQMLQEALTDMKPEQLALLSQQRPTNRIAGKLEQLSDLVAGGRGSRAKAEQALEQALRSRIPPHAVGPLTPQMSNMWEEIVGNLRGSVPGGAERAQAGWIRRLSRQGRAPTRGWKLGAGVGAALGSLPFVLFNLLRARQLRQQGGPAAVSARNRAVRLLSEAAQERARRHRMLKELPQ